jgi:hypothetical protein
LATDLAGKHTFAIEVKTNARTFAFWLLSPSATDRTSDSLVYAFVNLRRDATEFFVVPSRVVARRAKTYLPTKTRKTTWRSIQASSIQDYKDNWRFFEGRGLTSRSTRSRVKRAAARPSRDG